MIRSNPADRVERPRKEKFKSEIYSGEELEQLFKAIQGDPSEFGVIMAAFYGLRRSEVVGLKWDAIDFENKKIGIQHTVVTAKVNGTLTEIARDKTKTKSSCRTLPLIPACEQMLKKMKKEQEQNRKVCGRSYCTDYLDYIYVDPMGKRIRPDFLSQHFPDFLVAHQMKRILQAIKAVSQYVIENEAEFISQLKTVWNESKSKSANNGQQEIDEAKKRMAELDAKIQKLYDSAISGLLPERQAQRMIQQYDEEQLMLEKRVEELQGQIQEEEVEKIDTNRFIALVNKYRNCEELTDTMLYAFIDRVEVHEATGGRTVYRQQNIDIYFNFIGNYYPPVETVSEEERIAAIEAEQLRKKQEKAKRAAEVQKQKKAALMKAVEAGDPEAIAEYERKLALQRERNHRRQQKIKEAREADPAYIAQMEEKERLQREKLLEAERKRTERANRQKKLSRKELKEAAKTDPKAAEEWQALKEKEAVARQRKKEREEERMAADPEYAAMMAERKAEYTRTRTAKRQAEREALVELAKTDEEAAKKLAEMRKYQSQATVRSYQKMKADAEAGDPDAIKRYETTLAKRREEYHRKKGA